MPLEDTVVAGITRAAHAARVPTGRVVERGGTVLIFVQPSNIDRCHTIDCALGSVAVGIIGKADANAAITDTR